MPPRTFPLPKPTPTPNYEIRRLTRRDGNTQTIFGNLIANADQNIAQVHAFNFNAGSGDEYNFYINSMEVPEPGTATLLGLALLAVGGWLRRRR